MLDNTDHQYLAVIANRAKQGDQQAFHKLLSHFRADLKNLSIKYVRGLEYNDLQAIAMDAIWQAVNRWDSSRSVPFKAFALVVIRRKLSTAISESQRLHQQHLANAITGPMYDAEGNPIEVDEFINDPRALSAYDDVEARDWLLYELRQYLPNLSELETKLLMARIDHPDFTYKDLVANADFVNWKQVDNTGLRLRGKLNNPPKSTGLNPENTQ